MRKFCSALSLALMVSFLLLSCSAQSSSLPSSSSVPKESRSAVLDESSRPDSLPPYPSVKDHEKPSAPPAGKKPSPSRRSKPQPASSKEAKKARELFELARKENRGLKWDECLAGQAQGRARKMVEEGYFDHEQPETGQNPAWGLVASCHECRYAGENLAKGYHPAVDVHAALMKSPTHRKNILDKRYNRLGVGCYDYICVELFAGL